MQMQLRRIGQSDLEVFPVGLGTMGMSEFYGDSDEQEAIATLHAALDNGVNFFDTADISKLYFFICALNGTIICRVISVDSYASNSIGSDFEKLMIKA